jgi:4-alpha-glucanotransferase
VTTDGWGIDDGWLDTQGQWRAIAADTCARFRLAMGGEPERDGPEAGRGIIVARTGQPTALDGPGHLVLEDGTDVGEVHELGPDLPLGLHHLHPLDGGLDATVLAGPGRCHLPEGLRTWGLTMQVPTARSHGSWGIGDLADVRRLAALVGRRGGGAVGLSPLHAATPVSPLPASPYSPSSRRWHNPLLLRVDEVPGAAGDPVVAAEAAAARSLSAEPIVDRDRCWAHQRAALEHLWAARSDGVRARVDAWRAEQGPALECWARFCALAEVHGPLWSVWPVALRHPDAPAVAAAVAGLADRVAFHAWLQLLLADQLAAAATPGVRLVQDLAIGADPDGADAWVLQDLLALDVSIGAPPDDFVADGQVWGLPPFVPWKLRDAGYRPLAELLRASMAADGGLRVDHVMGLSRLFWVPGGATPHEGAYVRYPGRELLEVLAIESERAGALVVGEDLGTVEDHLRHELYVTGVLSTRVVWFEDAPPEHYPDQSLGMVTTHDLPTIAGVWTGADHEELAQLGRPAPAEATAAVHRRLEALVDVPHDAPVADVVERVHRRVSEGRSMLVLGTLEDLCQVPHRPNVPGTTTERANWSTALPIVLEDLPEDDAANRAIEALCAPRPAGSPPAEQGD